MFYLALRNLCQNTVRLLISVGGVALALMVILAFDAIFTGVEGQLTAYIDHSRADVFVAQAGVRNLHMSASWLPASVVDQVKRVPGVESATPILYVTDMVVARGTRNLMLHSSKRIYKMAAAVPLSRRRTAPDPRLGPRIELLSGESSGVVDLLGIAEVLPREGVPAEQAPPAFLQVQPARAGGQGHLFDAGVCAQPLPDRPAGVAGEVIHDEIQVARGVSLLKCLQQL